MTDKKEYGRIKLVIRDICMMPDVAGVVKWLTRRIVAPLCVGSSPTTRPIFFYHFWGYSQVVRQRTLTPLRGSSILPAPASIRLRCAAVFLLPFPDIKNSYAAILFSLCPEGKYAGKWRISGVFHRRGAWALRRAASRFLFGASLYRSNPLK